MKKSLLLTILALFIGTAQTIGQVIETGVHVLKEAPEGNQNESYEYKGAELVELNGNFSSTPPSGKYMHAYIDEDMVVGGASGTPFTDSDFDSHTVDASLPVGFIAGNHSVTPTGAVTYSVPIQVPVGTNGMTPSLSINYNSQMGSGLLGMGWTLGGLSAITRIPRIIYHDDEVVGVQLDETDVFALDGTRLFKTGGSGDYGMDGCEYDTELKSFSKIISHEQYSGTASGPKWFEVMTKDGRTIQFGKDDYTNGSKFWDNTGSQPIVYRVNKISDPYGNYMTFEYINDDRQSRISRILYTGNSVTNLQPYNEIRFHYQEREDKNVGFISGASVNSNVLLRKISLTSSGSHFKNYVFEYCSNGLQNFLKSITEYGSNGEQLNPTIFKYGEDIETLSLVNTSISTHTSNEISDNQGAKLIAGDYNGDGYTDLVLGMNEQDEIGSSGIIARREVKYKIWINDQNEGFNALPEVDLSTDFVQLNGTASHGAITGTGSADYTGDGKADLLLVTVNASNGLVLLNGIRILKFESNQFVEHLNITLNDHIGVLNGRLKSDIGRQYITTGDFNGDGITDILITLRGVSSSADNTDYAGYIFYMDDSGGYTLKIINGFNESVAPIGVGSFMATLDYDGDGKSDFIGVDQNGTKVYSFRENGSMITEYEEIYSGAVLSNLDDFMRFGDINGDGKTDIINHNTSGDWSIHLSKGKYGFRSANFPQLQGFHFQSSSADEVKTDELIITDLDGDGRSEIVHGFDSDGIDLGDPFAPELNFAGYTIYQNVQIDDHGTLSFSSEEFEFQDNHESDLSTPTLTVGDFNADGRADLINRASTESPIQMLYGNKDSKELYLAKLKDGFGNELQFDYQWLSQAKNGDSWYQHGTGSTYPLNDIKPSLILARSVTEPDGIGGTATTEYSYSEARMHRRGKGFLGFRTVTAGNLLENKRSVEEYELNSEYYMSLLKDLKTYTGATGTGSSGSLLSHSDITNEVVTDGDIYWVKQPQVINHDYVNATSTTSDKIYNHLTGNVEEETITNNAGVVKTTTTYVAFGQWHVPSRASSVMVESLRTGSPSVLKTTSFPEYDDFGGVLKEVSLGVTREFGRDEFGNVISTTVSSSGLPSSSSSVVMDNTGRFAIESINAHGQSSFAEYDGRWVKPIAATDILGHSGSYTYDGFGRLISSTDALGNTSSTTLSWEIGATPNSLYKEVMTSSGSPEVVVTYDAFGRELKTQTESYQQTVSSTTTYDAKGRVYTKTVPSGATGGGSITTTNQYDDVTDRITNSTNGVHSLTYNYVASGGQLTTSITDQSGVMRSSKVDAAGKILQSNDPGGQLEFTYSSDGQMKKTSIGGQLIVDTDYDENLNQDYLWDKNGNTTDYTYNAYGQLEFQEDPNGNVYDMVYDGTGRPQTTTGPDETISYSYYNSGGGLNKIRKIEGSNGYKTEFEYDEFGRTIKRTETIDAIPFEFQYTHDNNGNVTSITYPGAGGLKINYEYDSNGFLTTVKKESGEVIYQLNAVSTLGQVSEYQLGNGVTTTKEFTAFGNLQGLVAPGVTNQAYNWIAATGNLDWRSDDDLAILEDFEYDNLNRLDLSQVDFQSYVDVEYEPNGNIEFKSDVGDYTYDDDRINAVKTVENSDWNISTETQLVNYTSFDRTADIMENTKRAFFYYGPDHNRRKMEVVDLPTGPSAVESYRYYAGAYEELHTIDLANNGQEDIYGIHYISGGDGICAIYVTKNGSNGTFYFVYKDHMGSIIALTDENGNVVHRQNYDPWGRERNPDTWKYDFTGFSQPSLTDPNMPDPSVWMNRGYTGHEHLKEFALINMNNRMYDPAMARMLAVDNYVSDPNSTQAYNRYTYALNNPLRYTDPDGENPAVIVPIVIGAVVGAYIGGSMANGTYNPLQWKWKSGSTYAFMIGGAAVGAASAGAGIAVSGAIVGSSTVVGTGTIAAGLGGAMAGFTSGFGFSTLSGNDPWTSGLKGAAAGMVGGASGALIGGGAGAFVGGVASGVTGTVMNGGDLTSVGISAALGGALSYGMYHLQSHIAFKQYQKDGGTFNYKQFRHINARIQRGFSRGREPGGYGSELKGLVRTDGYGDHKSYDPKHPRKGSMYDDFDWHGHIRPNTKLNGVPTYGSDYKLSRMADITSYVIRYDGTVYRATSWQSDFIMENFTLSEYYASFGPMKTSAIRPMPYSFNIDPLHHNLFHYGFHLP